MSKAIKYPGNLVKNLLQRNPKIYLETLHNANCTSITADLFENTVLGHIKESFTRVINDWIGRFDEVDWGTLFINNLDGRLLEYRDTFKPLAKAPFSHNLCVMF